jgi:hypothetical protein
MKPMNWKQITTLTPRNEHDQLMCMWMCYRDARAYARPVRSLLHMLVRNNFIDVTRRTKVTARSIYLMLFALSVLALTIPGISIAVLTSLGLAIYIFALYIIGALAVLVKKPYQYWRPPK